MMALVLWKICRALALLELDISACSNAAVNTPCRTPFSSVPSFAGRVSSAAEITSAPTSVGNWPVYRSALSRSSTEAQRSFSSCGTPPRVMDPELHASITIVTITPRAAAGATIAASSLSRMSSAPAFASTGTSVWSTCLPGVSELRRSAPCPANEKNATSPGFDRSSIAESESRIARRVAAPSSSTRTSVRRKPKRAVITCAMACASLPEPSRLLIVPRVPASRAPGAGVRRALLDAAVRAALAGMNAS